ncbi:hypothetical protein HK405_011014, partial [Cladochytrium tenue]
RSVTTGAPDTSVADTCRAYCGRELWPELLLRRPPVAVVVWLCNYACFAWLGDSGGPKQSRGPPAWLWIVPAATFALGVWQVYRLRWKLDLIESARASLQGEPLELADALSQPEGIPEFQPVRLRGRFLPSSSSADSEMAVGPRSRGAAAGDDGHQGGGLFSNPSSVGYFIVQPFEAFLGVGVDGKPTATAVLLVNRGWVPREGKAFSAERSLVGPGVVAGDAAASSAGPVIELVGLWRRGER